MNERQLRYSLAVRDERSFSRAAKRLNVSQPSISLQVRQLEDDLGFALFERTAGRIEPTFLGRKFLEQAEQAMAGFAGLADVARQLRRGPTRGFAIGISSGISPFVLPLVVAALGPNVAEIRLEVATAPSPRIQRLVLQELIDLGIVVEISGRHILPELRRERVGVIEMALFVPSGHRLAQRNAPVNLAEIVQEPLVINEPKIGYGELVLSMFNDQGLYPNVVAISDSVGAAKLMVRSGVGCSILPALSAPYELQSGDLVKVGLAPPRTVSVDLIVRLGKEATRDGSPDDWIREILRQRLTAGIGARNAA